MEVFYFFVKYSSSNRPSVQCQNRIQNKFLNASAFPCGIRIYLKFLANVTMTIFLLYIFFFLNNSVVQRIQLIFYILIFSFYTFITSLLSFSLIQSVFWVSELNLIILMMVTLPHYKSRHAHNESNS